MYNSRPEWFLAVLLVSELLSPCVRICTLDDNNICLGCGRTVDEITSWARLSVAERQRIMDRLAAEGRRWPVEPKRASP